MASTFGFTVQTYLVFGPADCVEVRNMQQYGWEVDGTYERLTKATGSLLATIMVRVVENSTAPTPHFLKLHKTPSAGAFNPAIPS